jgi:hypothetical protein
MIECSVHSNPASEFRNFVIIEVANNSANFDRSIIARITTPKPQRSIPASIGAQALEIREIDFETTQIITCDMNRKCRLFKENQTPVQRLGTAEIVPQFVKMLLNFSPFPIGGITEEQAFNI